MTTKHDTISPFKGLRPEMYSYDVDLVEYNCASGSYRRIQIRYFDKQGTLLYVNEADQLEESSCNRRNIFSMQFVTVSDSKL